MTSVFKGLHLKHLLKTSHSKLKGRGYWTLAVDSILTIFPCYTLNLQYINLDAYRNHFTYTPLFGFYIFMNSIIKLGHPVPESNFGVDLNNEESHIVQIDVPNSL